MPTLPQLIEEDIQTFDEALRELLKQTEATTALIIDQGGFLITHHGDSQHFDVTTIAALTSGAYMANQTIASLVHETTFNSIYQQGENVSIFALSIDENCVLVVIFAAQLSVGAVKYFAVPAAHKIAKQMVRAQERDPAGGLDLSVLNVADPAELFKRK